MSFDEKSCYNYGKSLDLSTIINGIIENDQKAGFATERLTFSLSVCGILLILLGVLILILK